MVGVPDLSKKVKPYPCKITRSAMPPCISAEMDRECGLQEFHVSIQEFTIASESTVPLSQPNHAVWRNLEADATLSPRRFAASGDGLHRLGN